MSDRTPLEIELEARLEALRVKKKTQQKKVEDTELEIQGARRQLRDEWNRKASLDVTNLKDVLSERYGIPQTDPRFQKAFDIAWSRGHSAGLNEVASCFDEMADLLK